MHKLITNPSELRDRGFQALTEALGWVNAVRFCDYTIPAQVTIPKSAGHFFPTGIHRS